MFKPIAWKNYYIQFAKDENKKNSTKPKPKPKKVNKVARRKSPRKKTKYSKVKGKK